MVPPRCGHSSDHLRASRAVKVGNGLARRQDTPRLSRSGNPQMLGAVRFVRHFRSRRVARIPDKLVFIATGPDQVRIAAAHPIAFNGDPLPDGLDRRNVLIPDGDVDQLVGDDPGV